METVLIDIARSAKVLNNTFFKIRKYAGEKRIQDISPLQGGESSIQQTEH